MGDPRRSRKKYSGPLKRWDAARIEAEKKLISEYALKNKRELRKAEAVVAYLIKRVKLFARDVTKDTSAKEAEFLARVKEMGYLGANAKLDDILGLQSKNVLERRLQSMTCRKGLAHSMKQARQYITHNHITVNGRVMNVPSYQVPVSQEGTIAFHIHSRISPADHPERTVQKKPAKPAREQRSDFRGGGQGMSRGDSLRRMSRREGA